MHGCTPISLFPCQRTEILTLLDKAAPGHLTSWHLENVPITAKQGSGITVAVLDTGADLDHPDLIDNLKPGFNLIDPSKPPEDDSENGHGTHATGIIVANNKAVGVMGVAPKAKVLPIKVLDKNGNGNTETLVKGIHLAIQNRVDFITLSLGCPVPIPDVQQAIIEANNAGILVFCAAGNSKSEVYFPAAYPTCVAIAALDKNYLLAKFSNRGETLDYACPGQDIISTVPPAWYASMSGTSMATPFAAGLACLVKAECPDCDVLDIFQRHAIPVKDSPYFRIDTRNLLESDK